MINKYVPLLLNLLCLASLMLVCILLLNIPPATFFALAGGLIIVCAGLFMLLFLAYYVVVDIYNKYSIALRTYHHNSHEYEAFCQWRQEHEND